MSEATQALRRQQHDARKAKRAGIPGGPVLCGLDHPIDVPEGGPIPAIDGDAIEGLAAAAPAPETRKKRTKKAKPDAA